MSKNNYKRTEMTELLGFDPGTSYSRVTLGIMVKMIAKYRRTQIVYNHFLQPIGEM